MVEALGLAYVKTARAKGGGSQRAAAPEVAASTGSACHAGEESASSILTAMGVEPSAALGSVRLSLGRTTTREDVVAAADSLAGAWRRLSPARVDA